MMPLLANLQQQHFPITVCSSLHCIILHAVYSMQPTRHSMSILPTTSYCTPHPTHCILHTECTTHCILLIVYFILHTSYCVLHTAYTMYCIPHTVYYIQTLNTVQLVYTDTHSVLQLPSTNTTVTHCLTCSSMVCSSCAPNILL